MKRRKTVFSLHDGVRIRGLDLLDAVLVLGATQVEWNEDLLDGGFTSSDVWAPIVPCGGKTERMVSPSRDVPGLGSGRPD
jgi:hypothetical protein